MEHEILRAALVPSPACLALEALGRYADGLLSAEERAAADSHVGGCLNCQAELALLQAVRSGDARAGEAEVVREGVARLERGAGEVVGAPRAAAPPARRWLGLRPAALAAAVAVVAAGLYFGQERAPRLPEDVSPGGEVTRSLTVAVRGPVGDLREAPTRLEWRPVDGAASYRVRLFEVDRTEVWSTTTSDAGVDLPPSVRPALVPGRTLVWEVRAEDGAGRSIAESGAQRFRVVLP
jgi:hypothetical protein